VPEDITFNLFGADVRENYKKLAFLLDMAGRPDEVVTFRVQLEGSALPSAQETQLRKNNKPAISAPPSFHSLLFTDEVDGVSINIIRDGLFLGSTDTVAVTAAANPAILTATMAEELDIVGPTKVTFELEESTDGLDFGYMVVTDYKTDDIVLVGAESLSGATTENQSATFALGTGGDVLVHTAVSIAEGSYSHVFSPALTGIKYAAVFVSLRNASSTTQFLIRAKSSHKNLKDVTRYTVVGAGQGRQWYNLGILASPSGTWDAFYIEIIASAATGASQKIYVDGVLFLPLGENTTVVKMGEQENRDFGTYAHDIVIDHRALSDKTPIANIVANSEESHMNAVSYEYIETAGDTVVGIFLATKSDGTYWRFTDDANAAVQDIGLNVVRHKSYLVPQ
jgi:hypothetical protein